MADEVEPGIEKQYRKTSAWPMFVALGFVLSEVGVILGFFPVTVGGLLLFGGAVAGILRESGYVSRPAVSLVVLGLFLGASGLVVVLLQVGVGDLSVAVLTDRTRPFVYRGAAVTASGLILLAVAVAVWVRDR